MHNYNWKEYIKEELGEKHSSELNGYFAFEHNEEKILILVKIVSFFANEIRLMNIETKFKENLVNKKEFDKAVLILLDPNKLSNKYGKENSFVLVYTYNKDIDKVQFHQEEFKINNFRYYFDIFDKKNNKEIVNNEIKKIKDIFNKMKIKNKWEEKYVFLTMCFLVVKDRNFSWDTKEKNTKVKIFKTTEKIKEIMKEIFNIKEELYENAIKKLTDAFTSQSTSNQSKIDTDFILNIDDILTILKERIIPNIKHNTEEGEKSLNLLSDFLKKNDGEHYTPNHIIDFMCNITDLSFDSTVIDPVCGSGSFLFNARSKMIREYENDFNMIQKINENLIGVEKSSEFFCFVILRTLIHKANFFKKGEFNIYNGNLFEKETQEYIKKSINENKSTKNVVLMNPPFTDNNSPNKKENFICTKEESKEELCNKRDECTNCNKKKLCEKHKNCKDYEKSKNECCENYASGFCYVKTIADIVGNGMLATILPLDCSRNLKNHRKIMLERHTLKAVFSLPNDVFYPGSLVSTCIMLFELGTPHNSNENTFFGYYKNDGFHKKKGEGRVEKYDWERTKDKWLKVFKNKEVIPGFSVLKNVNYDDEWLAEAYMETDYSQLTKNDFIQAIRDFIAFKVKNGDINE